MMLRFVVVFLLFVSGVSAHAADFQTGSDAYDRGDYATALEEWRPLAEQGDAVAQAHLGLMYAKGEGVPEDDQGSSEWYRLAAEQGDAEAQFGLGWMYEKGKVFPKMIGSSEMVQTCCRTGECLGSECSGFDVLQWRRCSQR